jgi:hypothetical protein
LSTVQQLKDYLGYADQASLKFKLANDITLESGLFVPYVSGYFDPNGKTINNLSLSQNTSNLGFIGYLNGRTTTQALTGLTMSNASVLGKLNVGTQVGASYLRAISLATSSGSVTGADLSYQLDPGDAIYSSGSNSGNGNAGGIVGLINASSITTNALDSATSSVTVSGGSHVGGLVGRLNTGTLTNSTASGAVSGVNFVGGLVGRQYYGSLTGSSATNAVTGLSGAFLLVIEYQLAHHRLGQRGVVCGRIDWPVGRHDRRDSGGEHTHLQHVCDQQLGGLGQLRGRFDWQCLQRHGDQHLGIGHGDGGGFGLQR